MKNPVRPILAVVLLAAAGCATGGDLPVERPEIDVAQVNTSAFIQERGGMFAVEYLIQIVNPGDIPITARMIELQTGAGSPYVIRETKKNLKHEIPAGGIEVLEISAWAYSRGGRGAASEPVILTLRIRFDSAKGSFQVSEIARILQ